MSNRNKDRLAALNSAMQEDSVEEAAEATATKSGVGSLLQRTNSLSQIASGAKRTVQLLMHAPDRIRLWPGHNRDYGLLSVERCGDLIEGFTRTGSQEFPAIVRRIGDNSDFDFEVICGARRHWTAKHLGWDLLIEVRDLDDRQAFILQDLENRDREDVSDYERAVDYKQALPKYFEGNRAAMAKFLEIDKGNFHRLMDLAELPKALVEAYADIRELRVHHGTAYRKLLTDSASKRRLLAKAKACKGSGMSGAKLFAELKATGQGDKHAGSARSKSFGALKASRKPGARALNITLTIGESGLPMSEQKLLTLRQDFDSVLSEIAAGRL